MKMPLTLIDNEPAQFATNLPLRKGSDGYNTPQDYNIKGHLPSNTLASIYGPSGSYVARRIFLHRLVTILA